MRSYVNVETVDGAQWSTRTGTVTLADGSTFPALLTFCDSDSGEHYGTALTLPNGDTTSQGDDDFAAKLGKTKAEIFPYRYKYDGVIDGDHHISDDGWSA